MNKSAYEGLESVDFALGILNAATETHPYLRLRGGDRSLDRAFDDATSHFDMLVDNGEVTGIRRHFDIRVHPIHGDSPTVFDTMWTLSSLDFILRVGGSNRSQIWQFNRGTAASAEEFHAKHKIPGSLDMYRKLAGRFIKIVSGEVVEPLEANTSSDEHEHGQHP